MLEYIINNKEWIFSGAGVTGVAILGTYFLKRLMSKDEPDSVFDIVQPPVSSIISLYSLVPNFILRYRFKETRINSFIKIDVRPRGESIRLNLGELPDCQIWVQLVNHSPFDLDIESIQGELNYNGCRVSVETRDHIDVSKHSSNGSILLEGTLTGEQAIHCSKENNTSYTSLTLRTRIGTTFGVFKKYSGDLQYMHVSTMNKREKQA
ncbi:MAG: hypothetical protein KZQ91_20690 [Candidatus Thiodiazotropha sp. (ex Lucinoma borealis)]|nr:hypothetical protein [Candidatus Thiodiazotropha sp. (ex Lucinoma borealis)]